MYVGRRKLVVKRAGLHVEFEAVGKSIVQDLWDVFEVAIGEVLAEICEGSGDIALAVGLNEFCKDFVRIVVVEIHDVLGAAAGGVQETTSLVTENLAGNIHHLASPLWVQSLALVRRADVVMTCGGATVAEFGAGFAERTFWRYWRR